MKYLGPLVFCLTIALSQQGPADAASTSDSWEDNNTRELLGHPCVELDRSLIAPVPADRREQAIAKLSKISAIALNEDQADTFLGLGRDVAMASASGRIKAAIAELKEQKRLELEERIGSWGASFQQRLDALEVLGASTEQQSLKPYLVRAIAKNEITGGFYVSVCGDTLGVTHGSLGRGPTPPTLRLPIIVFLGHAPKSVLATWGRAQ